MTDERRARVEAARDRFHDEAHASPTLHLRSASEGLAFDLSRLADGGRGTRVLASIAGALGASENMTFVLCVAGDGTPVSNAIGALAHAARCQRIEVGADDLAIGFPWLEGRIADGTWVRAPLFLYPVSLYETLEGPWAWTLETQGAPWMNEPLAALFRRLTRVRIGYQDFLAHDEDGLFKADDPTWQGFVKTLQRAGVTLADTAKAMPASPIPFESSDDAKVAAIPPGQFRLMHHLVLGRFPVLAANTAADYEALLATTLDAYNLAGAAPIFDVRADDPGFFGRAHGRAADDPGTMGPLRRWQVLPTDPWQEDALRSVEGMLSENDTGLVVAGAPGTGRSQLLANIAAGAIQKGLKVLITSPRRAALDDVAWRLAGVGLGEPLALVHDPWRDRTSLCHGIAETADPLVNELPPPPDTNADTQAMIAAERAVGARLDAADQAFDAVTGRDGGLPGLAEIDEHALVDTLGALPDLSELVSGIKRPELDRLLPHVAKLAPQAAPFITPHPLSARSDWGRMSARDVSSFYAQVEAAREAIATWARLRGLLPAPELDRQRAMLADARPIIDLAEADDPDLFTRHADVVRWLEEPTPEDVHTRFLEELRDASVRLELVPSELVKLPKKELAERIQSLDKLHKMETSGLRVFSPAFWSLKKLPEKFTATLPPATPKEPDKLAELHRQAEAWQKVLDSMPDEPAFALAEVGDPWLLRELVDKLDKAFAICRAEALVIGALAEHGFPAAPDWQSWGTARRDASPFLAALSDEHARARALTEIYEALAPLAGPMTPGFVKELGELARDRPAGAEARLKALAATAEDGPKVLAIDQATAKLPPLVAKFLREYAGASEDAKAAFTRAVEEAWRMVRLGDASEAAVEAALVDPRELRALAEAMSGLEASRAHAVLSRWKARVHALTEVESQRQDLTKLVNEAGRKRLRESLRQIVERYWKRGLATLRPIWFAPLDAVASIFPKDRDAFDLVIIDEANRASFGSALPALLRGRRVVIVGDPFQAPPYTPKDAGGDVMTLESYRAILPLARGVWPQTSLWWCWGARREELWTFPNAAAYGGAVMVAPNAERRERAKCEGLRWMKVDGRWDEGANKAETDKVVELVAEALGDKIGDESPSIGVVAFTKAQAALIRRGIDKRAARDEAFKAALRKDRERPEHEQLVVGDLEELPVDGRDVLILSLSYATTDTSKRLQTDFGQLAAPDGEGLITGVIARARVGLAVVTSFHDVALDAGRRPELGPKVLDALVGYAQGIALGDERIVGAALDRLRAATGIELPPFEESPGVGDVARDLLAEPLIERGLGIARTPLPGPVPPDMTVAPTQKSPPRAAIQTTRYLQEPDVFVRDIWARRFWQRQGWTIVRVTPGVWRAGPNGVVRSLEKLFSLSPRAEAKIMALAERRAEEERRAAEAAKARLEEDMRWAAEAEAEAAARWAAEAEEATRAEREAAEAAALESRLAAEAEAQAAEAAALEARLAAEAETQAAEAEAQALREAAEAKAQAVREAAEAKAQALREAAEAKKQALREAAEAKAQAAEAKAQAAREAAEAKAQAAEAKKQAAREAAEAKAQAAKEAAEAKAQADEAKAQAAKQAAEAKAQAAKQAAEAKAQAAKQAAEAKAQAAEAKAQAAKPATADSETEAAARAAEEVRKKQEEARRRKEEEDREEAELLRMEMEAARAEAEYGMRIAQEQERRREEARRAIEMGRESEARAQKAEAEAIARAKAAELARAKAQAEEEAARARALEKLAAEEEQPSIQIDPILDMPETVHDAPPPAALAAFMVSDAPVAAPAPAPAPVPEAVKPPSRPVTRPNIAKPPPVVARPPTRPVSAPVPMPVHVPTPTPAPTPAAAPVPRPQTKPAIPLPPKVAPPQKPATQTQLKAAPATMPKVAAPAAPKPLNIPLPPKSGPTPRPSTLTGQAPPPEKPPEQ